MEQERASIEPLTTGTPAVSGSPARRTGLALKQKFALALLPTGMVLGVLGLVQAFSHQQLLFASLASSAFLIYLDPQHSTNSTRTLLIAQSLAALTGFLAYQAFGPGYGAGGGAMVVIITAMILLDAVHPPAVSTALSFAFRAGPDSNLLLFGLALAMILVLVALQRASLWLLHRYNAA